MARSFSNVFACLHIMCGNEKRTIRRSQRFRNLPQTAYLGDQGRPSNEYPPSKTSIQNGSLLMAVFLSCFLPSNSFYTLMLLRYPLPEHLPTKPHDDLRTISSLSGHCRCLWRESGSRLRSNDQYRNSTSFRGSGASSSNQCCW